MGFIHVLTLASHVLAFSNGTKNWDNPNYHIGPEGKTYTQRARAGRGIDHWGGVRYAQPQKRWTAPEAYNGDLQHAIDNRVNDWKSCPQGSWDTNSQSEDCLFLNIFKPKGAKNLPIFIWIHGGHFQNGNAHWYGGGVLTRTEELVYVSLQYRLGPFGFWFVPNSWHSGNYGLMDQQMAIKFVYDHAEQIGGDKNRITIAGESAGSISVSLQMLHPVTSSMVQSVIPMSGPPNLISEPQWTNGNAHYFIDALCAESDIACPGGSINDKLNHLKNLNSIDQSWKIHAWITGSFGFGAVNGGPFWGNTNPIQVAESGQMKPANMLIGFTSFEGSLVEHEYPNTYNVDNVMGAYGTIGGHNSYGECVNYSYDRLVLLLSRYYQRMSCEYNFPLNQADMENSHAIKLALAIYGDVLFRSGSVRHAELYKKAGHNTWVYNFDTEETTVQSSYLNGAPHASELKYLFGWGLDLQNKPWQKDIENFMVTSWINFAVTGNPSSASWQWDQYDLDEGHMEIENTASNGVFRNDKRFDWDLLINLDENDLDDVYSTSCATTVITTTTQQPANWCQRLILKGDPTQYGFNGEYVKESTVHNGMPHWKKGMHSIYMASTKQWSVGFGLDQNVRLIWTPHVLDVDGGCAGHAQTQWLYWNGANVVNTPGSFSLKNKDSSQLTTTAVTQTTTAYTEATTTGSVTTKVTTSAVSTTQPPSDSCDVLYINGHASVHNQLNGIYTKIPGELIDGKPVWRYPGFPDRYAERFIYYRQNGDKWIVGPVKGGTVKNGNTMAKIKQTVECPGRETGMWTYEDTLSPNIDAFAVLVNMVVHTSCKKLEVKGPKTELYENDGIYTAMDGVTHNGAPVWKVSSDEERYLFLSNQNYWQIFYEGEGPDAFIWHLRSAKAENCPGLESGNWGYFEDGLHEGDSSLLSVTLLQEDCSQANEIQLEDNCHQLVANGPTHHDTNGIYNALMDTRFNCAPVWHLFAEPRTRYLFKSFSGKWTISESINGAPVMQTDQINSCPGDDGAWSHTDEISPDLFDVIRNPTELPTGCDILDVTGTKVDIFNNGGRYLIVPNLLRNGAPVWRKTDGEGDDARYIYLHDNNYWHIWLEPEGLDGLIWHLRDAIAANNCPGLETGNWGYWNDALLVGTPEEISVTIGSNPTTTTSSTTVVTTSAATTTEKPTTKPTTTVASTTQQPAENCEVLFINGLASLNNQLNGIYTQVPGEMSGGKPVWRYPGIPDKYAERFIYYRKNDDQWIVGPVKGGTAEKNKMARIKKTNECPGRESGMWTYGDTVSPNIDTFAVLVNMGIHADCDKLEVKGPKAELNGNDGIYTQSESTHNGAPVWISSNGIRHLWLSNHNTWHIWTDLDGTADPFIWNLRTAKAENCPGIEQANWNYSEDGAFIEADSNELSVTVVEDELSTTKETTTAATTQSTTKSTPTTTVCPATIPVPDNCHALVADGKNQRGTHGIYYMMGNVVYTHNCAHVWHLKTVGRPEMWIYKNNDNNWVIAKSFTDSPIFRTAYTTDCPADDGNWIQSNGMENPPTAFNVIRNPTELPVDCDVIEVKGTKVGLTNSGGKYYIDTDMNRFDAPVWKMVDGDISRHIYLHGSNMWMIHEQSEGGATFIFHLRHAAQFGNCPGREETAWKYLDGTSVLTATPEEISVTVVGSSTTTQPTSSTTTASTTKSTTTASTQSTTTDVPTTTTTKFDPATCDPIPVLWPTTKGVKWMYHGSQSATVRVNVLSMTTKPKVQNLYKQPYVGFLIFSRKMCGTDFMAGFGDGRLNFEVMDTTDGYDTAGQTSFYRSDGGRTSTTISFIYQNSAVLGLGSKKRDQFFFSIWGIKEIDFGTKNWKKCLESAKIGFLVNGAKQDEINGPITIKQNGKPAWVTSAISGTNFTPCVGWQKNVGVSKGFD